MKNEIRVLPYLYTSINTAWVRGVLPCHSYAHLGMIHRDHGNDGVAVVFALAKIIVGDPIKKNLTSNNEPTLIN